MGLVLTLGQQGYQWWDLVPALGGAVVGALIGAIPTFVLARKSANDVLRRDEAARTEASKAAIYRVSAKLLLIVDTILDLRRFIRAALERKNEPGRENMEPWQHVPARTGDSEHDAVVFDPDELALFLADQQYEFMQQLMLLERRARSVMSSFNTYCVRREAFREIAPIPTEYDGSLGRSHVTPEELARLKIYTIPLNTLVTGIASHLEEDWRLISEVIEKFNEIARRHLQQPGFTMGLEEDADTTTYPDDES